MVNGSLIPKRNGNGRNDMNNEIVYVPSLIKSISEDCRNWLSKVPDNCEVCHRPLGKYFIDGDTGHGWALMCEECHKGFGKGLGIGKGQKYVTKTGEGVDGFNEEE